MSKRKGVSGAPDRGSGGFPRLSLASHARSPATIRATRRVVFAGRKTTKRRDRHGESTASETNHEGHFLLCRLLPAPGDRCRLFACGRRLIRGLGREPNRLVSAPSRPRACARASAGLHQSGRADSNRTRSGSLRLRAAGRRPDRVLLSIAATGTTAEPRRSTFAVESVRPRSELRERRASRRACFAGVARLLGVRGRRSPRFPEGERRVQAFKPADAGRSRTTGRASTGLLRRRGKTRLGFQARARPSRH